MIFVGKRPDREGPSGPGTVYVIDEENISVHLLSPRRSVRGQRFADGFSWGYPGEGPLQLSLALLLELTNDEELSLELCLSLREDLIEDLQANCWAIDADEFQKWITDQVDAAENVR